MLLLAGCTLVTAAPLAAQENQRFPQQEHLPFPHQDKVLLPLEAAYESRHQAVLSSLQEPYKKELSAEYQKRFEAVRKIYRTKQLVTDTQATAYLQRVADRILKANPKLQALQPVIHFSRAWWPNAVSYGEGTILFNISLFHRLQNEAQAAFVLSHELAHYYLDHSNRGIREYVQTVNDPAFRQQLKSIHRMEYQRNKSANELVKNLSYTSRRHSRDHESEADSLALVFLQPTGYDLRAALSCLALLDSIDAPKYAGQLALERQFHFDDYPFRQRWIRPRALSLSEARDAMGAGTPAAETDSLKTHPDCSQRISALHPAVEKEYRQGQRLFLEDPERFTALVNRFDLELVAYCLDAQETGRALYYALQLFHRQPDNAWLATTIGRCLNILYTAQKTHNLGNMVDLPGTSRNAEYETWLRFLQSVKLDELAAIGYHFMQQHKDRFGSDADYRKAMTENLAHYKSHNH